MDLSIEYEFGGRRGNDINANKVFFLIKWQIYTKPPNKQNKQL